MRTFEDLKQQHKVFPFGLGPLGNRYRILGNPSLVVLHFEGKNPQLMRAAYVDLLVSLQDWLNAHSELVWFAKVQQPYEVGVDFVSRLWQVYTTSLESFESDDPPQKPPQLEEMRELLRQSSADNEEDTMIETILRRNLLEPSPKTYPTGEVGKHVYFIIVEPKVTYEEIVRWAQVRALTR